MDKSDPALSLLTINEIAPGLNDLTFRKNIVAAFEETFGIRFLEAHPTEEELALARDLEEAKYLRPEWVFRR